MKFGQHEIKINTLHVITIVLIIVVVAISITERNSMVKPPLPSRPSEEEEEEEEGKEGKEGKKNRFYRMMETSFKNTSPIPTPITSNTGSLEDQYALPNFEVGGVLVNNFALNWFQDFIKKGKVSFQGTAVCAHRTRKSCTAYSLLRSDLIPVFFQFPGAGQSVPCGIILDPTKAWPLITGMFVNDADTNARNCCSNEAEGEGSPLTCAEEKSLFKSRDPPRSIDFRVDKNPGSSEDNCGLRDCNGDRTCMMLQSGASINPYKLQQIPGLCSREGTDFSNSSLCAKPYVCVMENAPSYSKDVRGNTVQPNFKYKIVEEGSRIANYIGKDGEGYIPLLNADCPGVGVDMDGTGSAPCPKLGSKKGVGGGNITDGISHCKFKRDDWNYWIKTLKRFYKEYEKRFPSNKPETFYIENEVNLYVNPNNSKEAFIQQKLFENAIIGFYYISNNCDQQLQWLTPEKTVEGKTGGRKTGGRRTGSVRCDDYFQDILKDPFLNENNKITGGSQRVTRGQRQKWENLMIQISRQLVHQVADLFEKQTSRKVPVYKSTASSNAFMNFDEVKKAQNNNIKLSSIFQLDTDYKYSEELQKNYVNKEWVIQA